MNKYGSGASMEPFKAESFKNIYIAQVVAVGKISMSDEELANNFIPEEIEGIKNSLKRFNADEHSIKVPLLGSTLDGSIKNGEYSKSEKVELPNALPMLPKHLNLVPKVGELVLVMVQSSAERFNDRFYLGPVISSPINLDKDISTNSSSSLSFGVTGPTEDISKIPLARGVYENPQNVVIEGRNNTDIIQRKEEILLRSGKFLTDNPLEFNSKNPGYIQIKSNFNYNIENDKFFTGPPSPNGTVIPMTVTNIVSDRINLITYDGSPNFSSDNGLTTVNKKTNVAEYINDDKLEEILNDAHQLVFGDKLIEYLKLLRTAFENHVHNGSGNKPCDNESVSLAVQEFKNEADRLEKEMLSKNIRIN